MESSRKDECMIAIIDYDAGNLRSVEKALLALGEHPVVSRDRETILHADKVILPGVGSFGDAMEKLRQYDLVGVIRQVAAKGTPFLGICLGLQLMFSQSDERAGVEGLGSYVYFVHSYYLQAEDEKIVSASAEYGVHIHAAVERGNVFACQFHPEKSGDIGLKILSNFMSL